MTHRIKYSALALVFTLAACSTTVDPGEEEAEATTSEVEATSTVGRPEKEFKVEETQPMITTELGGQRVEDPAMELSYKWQGVKPAPGGGTVLFVAVTNESDAPMPADVLDPELSYKSGGAMTTASMKTAEAAGIDYAGLDLPLGPGATTNVKLPFDVAPGSLADAQLTIGNVRFQGNLNG